MNSDEKNADFFWTLFNIDSSRAAYFDLVCSTLRSQWMFLNLISLWWTFLQLNQADSSVVMSVLPDAFAGESFLWRSVSNQGYFFQRLLVELFYQVLWTDFACFTWSQSDYDHGWRFAIIMSCPNTQKPLSLLRCCPHAPITNHRFVFGRRKRRRTPSNQFSHRNNHFRIITLNTTHCPKPCISITATNAQSTTFFVDSISFSSSSGLFIASSSASLSDPTLAQFASTFTKSSPFTSNSCWVQPITASVKFLSPCSFTSPANNLLSWKSIDSSAWIAQNVVSQFLCQSIHHVPATIRSTFNQDRHLTGPAFAFDLAAVRCFGTQNPLHGRLFSAVRRKGRNRIRNTSGRSTRVGRHYRKWRNSGIQVGFGWQRHHGKTLLSCC